MAFFRGCAINLIAHWGWGDKTKAAGSGEHYSQLCFIVISFARKGCERNNNCAYFSICAEEMILALALSAMKYISWHCANAFAWLHLHTTTAVALFPL